MSEAFVGEIRMFGFNFAPRGWANCDGQLLSILQNSALFSLLGTMYGGDGKTNFGLPDLRGRVAVHHGQGPGLSNYTQGEKAGQEHVTLTQLQMPMHSHHAACNSGQATERSPEGHVWAKEATGQTAVYSGALPDATMSAAAIGPAGGGQPHMNLQPYTVVLFAIALQGMYPARD